MRTDRIVYPISKTGIVLAYLILCMIAVEAVSRKAPESEIAISYKKGIFSVQNDRFERQFRYDSSSQTHAFYPVSWIDKNRGLNIQADETKEWFELCVDGELIRSQSGGWDYDGFEKRALENGGEEVVVRLTGQEKVAPVLGRLQLNYRFQIFPGSTVIRERLEIVPQTGKTIQLNKYDDQVGLVFPRYDFAVSDVSRLMVQEIRLAEWEGEVLPKVDWSLRPNDRLQLTGGKSGRNLSQNHMYHPRRIVTTLPDDGSLQELRGPIEVVVDEQSQLGLILAYEHGSPDDDVSQSYLATGFKGKTAKTLSVQVRARKGAYVDGEKITPGNPYATVWVDVGFFAGGSFDQGEAIFWDFLYNNQSEHLAPRVPTIYYNTWGLQRDDQKEKKMRPQEVLTEERVLQEIDYAHQLGVDVFVIDDGWQNFFGDWQPVQDRFPDGLKRVRAKLDSLGMRMGLWLAAAGIDTNSNLYRQHPEWTVRNEDGTEMIGRWKKRVGCFSSGYRDYFTELCKYWIDQGVTYFKWDGLDKHLCYSPDHDHGDKSTNPEDRAHRSGYDFIIAVTGVAREITEYNPDVIIVYDVTEKTRNVGLAFLSEARFFWINNGATWYNDLSYYRTKSIRSVANLYNQIIPTVLQTSANYPHQSDMYGAQTYNLNTTLLGGGGFWGDLSEMSQGERKHVGEVVRTYKKVAPTVVSTRPFVTGSIGSSPEVYEIIDPEKAEGEIIAFSGSVLQTNYRTQPVNRGNFFCVLRNAYSLQEDGSIDIPLLFPQPDASCAAFVLSDSDFPGRIESSTSWLKEAEVTGQQSIFFVNGAPGRQRIFWPEWLGKPEVHSNNPDQTNVRIELVETGYQIVVEEKAPGINIGITSDIK